MRFRKTVSFGAEVMSGGKLFHVFEAFYCDTVYMSDSIRDGDICG